MSINVSTIPPNTNIELYEGVPWDNSYTNTLRAQNKDNTMTKRDTLFTTYDSSKKFVISKCLPVRNGTLRVPYCADVIMQFNYMRYQNTNFSSRYIYAFIKSINWVSYNTCEIEYEIDVLQTWLPVATLLPSYVSRCHNKTDDIGDNIQPEPIDTGYMIAERITQTAFFTRKKRKILVIYKPKDTIQCGFYGGNITALAYKVISYSEAGLNELTDFIQKVSDEGREDAIVSITISTSDFEPGQHVLVPSTYDMTVTNQSRVHMSNGSYMPKNKKLLTYPYMYMRVFSPTCQPLNLRYELFRKNGSDTTRHAWDARFSILGTYGGNMELLCKPTNYTLVTTTAEFRITISGFPQFPWLTDSYKAWLAQTASRRDWVQQSAAINAGIGVVGNVANLNFGGAVDAGLSYYNTMAEQDIAKDEAAINPTSVHGVSTTNASFLNDDMEFTFDNVHMEADYARRADDFLSRFGYAQNRIMVPDLHCRRNYTFIKITDLNMSGNIPNDARNKMKEIFANGVTFWEEFAYIGDYSVPNEIL